MRQSVALHRPAAELTAATNASVLHRLEGSVALHVLLPVLPALPPLVAKSELYQV
jgi:hypothetical protein